jgi:hypothetical protein
MESETAFDPRRHLIKLSGKDYLEVKWRVYWLRTAHPGAIISTELHKHVFASPDGTIPAEAIFRAHVIIPDGGEATGWGSESEADFHDYIEKAETKALGRALAALGFGVQFAGDDFEGVERYNDAPVQAARARQIKELDGGKKSGGKATAKQFADMKAWREAQNLTPEQMATIVLNITGKHEHSEMTEQDAGRVLYKLNRVNLDDLLAGNID